MSAWDQWGTKRSSGTVLNGAQDAFQSLLRASPASTASTSSDSELNASNAMGSLKKMWGSAQTLATGKSVNGGTEDVDALESGEIGGEDGEDIQSPTFPLWRKKTAPKSSSMLPSMSWNKRFKYFVGLALMTVLFFGMSSLFLPLIMIRPSKFALSFTLGSICAMGAFAMLKGPAAYIKDMMQPKSLVLTTVYLLTLASTLYCCLVLGSYLMVVCSAITQLITLVMMALSAFPGGKASIKTFGILFMKAARQLIQGFIRLLR